MPNTYTQIYIQLVFAVQGRRSLLQDNFRDDLHKYITGIITKRKQKLLAINSVKDHIHILIGLSTTITIADLVHDVKIASSKFIDSNKFLPTEFNWQVGYGAFSYSKSHLDNVIKYINNQQQHHKKKTFKDEYIEFLKKFEIDYNEKYLFEWIED